MYHYVRDLINSQYPKIKGLDIKLFKEQIFYLKKFYNFITMEQLIDSIDHNVSLPEKSVLLTFDDAYTDHYTHVFPVLIENEIQGSFFTPVKAITTNTVLNVNKIHFILASVDNKSLIIADLNNLLDKYRKDYNLNSNKFYYYKLAKANKYDTDEVIFIKRLLQVELVEELRNSFTSELFRKYIGLSESVFSRELYMSIDQIKTMKHFGMHIGSHGYDHYWLNSLSKEKQEVEIEKSIGFLKSICTDMNYWTMCYPYGAFNNDTINILDHYNCKLALTTNMNIADFHKENRFALSRLDTNELQMNKSL